MGNLPTYPSQLARTCYPENFGRQMPLHEISEHAGGIWERHWFKPKPNSPRRLNCIRGKNLENDIVMSVHITSLRPRLLLTLSQCNRCFVVGADDTHTKTVAPIGILKCLLSLLKGLLTLVLLSLLKTPG